MNRVLQRSLRLAHLRLKQSEDLISRHILENRKYFQMQKSLCIHFEIFLPIVEFLFTKAL